MVFSATVGVSRSTFTHTDSQAENDTSPGVEAGEKAELPIDLPVHPCHHLTYSNEACADQESFHIMIEGASKCLFFELYK